MIADVHHLIGAAEIGKLFGISRQRVQQLTAKPDFPAPVAELAMGKVWESTDVHQWGVATGRLVPEDDGRDES